MQTPNARISLFYVLKYIQRIFEFCTTRVTELTGKTRASSFFFCILHRGRLSEGEKRKQDAPTQTHFKKTLLDSFPQFGAKEKNAKVENRRPPPSLRVPKLKAEKIQFAVSEGGKEERRDNPFQCLHRPRDGFRAIGAQRKHLPKIKCAPMVRRCCSTVNLFPLPCKRKRVLCSPRLATESACLHLKSGGKSFGENEVSVLGKNRRK